MSRDPAPGSPGLGEPSAGDPDPGDLVVTQMRVQHPGLDQTLDQAGDVLSMGRGPARVADPRRGRYAAVLVAAVVVVLVLAAVTTQRLGHNDGTATSPNRDTAAGYSTALLTEPPLSSYARRVSAAAATFAFSGGAGHAYSSTLSIDVSGARVAAVARWSLTDRHQRQPPRAIRSRCAARQAPPSIWHSRPRSLPPS